MENQKTDLIQHFASLQTDQNKLLLEFEKPIHQNIFFSNINLLQTNSDLILFDIEKWYMRPELFCKDHYSNPYLYQLVMLVNNIKSIFEFYPDNFTDRIIVAPHLVEIKKLLTY
mgnify:CR=1 FL=1